MSKGRTLRRRTQANPKSDAPPAATSHWLDHWRKAATLVLTALCLLGLFSSEIADTDFWWHLKTGQYIAGRHSLPVPDPFAYTTAMAPSSPGESFVRHFNLTHEWLSQLLMYGVYALAGFPGIVMARALLLAALCGLSGFAAARLSQRFYAGIAAAGAAAAVMVAFAADRPSLVTFLGVAAFVCLLEMRRGYWALPPLALLWANCHGGFPLGWVVLLAYCGETVIRRAWTPESRRLWLASAGAILASGINPNGFGAVATMLAYRRSPMTANLIEWMPPKLWGPPYAFDLLLYAAALVLLLSWRRVRPAHWILFAVFAAASLMAFRNIALIGFLAPVLLAAYFPYPVKLPDILKWTPPVLAAAALAVVMTLPGSYNFRVAAWTIPEGAANFLLANHVTGPIFNTYEQGGYLIWKLWPEQRVFIDGRSLSDTLYRDYHQILFGDGSDRMTAGRAELLNRYGAQVVVMNAMDYVSGALYPLVLALGNPATADWQLAYEDTQAVVFLRRPAPGVPLLSNKLGRVLRHLDRECSAYVENSPDDAACARTLGEYWLHYGVRDAALRMIRLYLAHTPRPDPAPNVCCAN